MEKTKRIPIPVGSPNSPERKKWEARQERNRINGEIATLTAWFADCYSPQIEQYERSVRTSTAWSANDGEKTYTTLAELDAEANRKQEEIRALKRELEGQSAP